MHISIFDTQFTKATNVQKNIDNVIKYLVNNRQVAIYGTDRDAIIDTKVILMTPLNKFYEHIKQIGILSNFTFLNTGFSSDDIPELLAIPDITIDTNQIQNNNVLNTLPEFKNKVLLNLNQLIKQSNNGVRINDIAEFHAQIVRGTLVMSYDKSQNTMWLTPNLLMFITKAYSITIGGLIKWLFNLNLMEENVVNTILSYYFLGQMTPDPANLINGCSFLGGRSTIENMILSLKDHGDLDKLNLDKVAKLISATGPTHMKKFEVSTLTRLCAKLHPSNITSFISLEYPPYFVYLLILAFSGNKFYLSTLLQQQKLLKEGVEFLKNLDTAKSFLPELV